MLLEMTSSIQSLLVIVECLIHLSQSFKWTKFLATPNVENEC